MHCIDWLVGWLVDWLIELHWLHWLHWSIVHVYDTYSSGRRIQAPVHFRVHQWITLLGSKISFSLTSYSTETILPCQNVLVFWDAMIVIILQTLCITYHFPTTLSSFTASLRLRADGNFYSRIYWVGECWFSYLKWYSLVKHPIPVKFFLHNDSLVISLFREEWSNTVYKLSMLEYPTYFVAKLPRYVDSSIYTDQAL